MRRLSYPLKSAISSWRRSLTIGVFVAALCFLGLISASVVEASVRSMRAALAEAFTGQVQIRPASTTEKDMVDIMKSDWGALPLLSPAAVERAKAALAASGFPGETVARIRQNLVLVSDKAKEPVLALGLDLEAKGYRRAIVLSSGRFPKSDGEMLLTSKDALALGVKVGDEIGAIGTSPEGYMADGAFRVVGIGSIDRLGAFGISAAFCSRGSLASMLGIERASATDVVAILDDETQIARAKALVAAAIAKTGGKREFALSDIDSMGGFVVSVANATAWFLYGSLAVLMAVMSVLIADIVALSCIERRKEIGTLRAMGFSRRHVAAIFVAETSFVALVGAAVGLSSAVLAIGALGDRGFAVTSPSMAYGFGNRVSPRLSWSDLPALAAFALSFTALAALVPSFRAAGAAPSEVLREE